MNLCKYKNIFGKPNTGVHSIRIFNIAFVDLFLTILGGYFINKYYFDNNNFLLILLILLLLSIIIHKLFCVDTTLTKYFFS